VNFLLAIIILGCILLPMLALQRKACYRFNASKEVAISKVRLL